MMTGDRKRDGEPITPGSDGSMARAGRGVIDSGSAGASALYSILDMRFRWLVGLLQHPLKRRRVLAEIMPEPRYVRLPRAVECGAERRCPLGNTAEMLIE